MAMNDRNVGSLDERMGKTPLDAGDVVSPVRSQCNETTIRSPARRIDAVSLAIREAALSKKSVRRLMPACSPVAAQLR